MLKIAAYCRVSTEKEEQLSSLENQKEFFIDFAKKHNYKLINLYADEGISGKQTRNRTQFLKMLEDSKLKIFDMVVVKDISRFARNTVDFLNSIRQLKSEGIEVQFLSNNQTILGNSEFVLTVFSALAQEESANLSKRVKFGKKINAKKGRVPNIIYGYDRIDNFTLKINDDESIIVKQMFEWYKQGEGSRSIAAKLTNMGIPTKKNAKLWTPKTVRRILMNPVYIGILINNKSEIIDFLSGTKKQHSPEDYFYHERPEFKIVSKEDFNTVQTLIKERQEYFKNENPAGRYSNKHVFSNLIQCGECGYTFVRKAYKYKNTYKWICSGRNNFTKNFCCNSSYPEESELINSIYEYFEFVLANKESFLSKSIEKNKKSNSSTNIQLDTLVNQVEKINKAKEKYKQMYTNDIITIEELKSKIEEFNSEEISLKSQVADYQKSIISVENIKKISEERFLKIEEIVNTNHPLTNSELRDIIEKIIIYKDNRIEFVLK